MMTRAPSRPHRVRSWASPWATVMIWMPLPPESASQDGTGHRADLGDLVQGHQQRRVQPPAGQLAARQRGDVVDLVGQAGEQRRDGGVLAAGLGDQVQASRPRAGTRGCPGTGRARAERLPRGRGRRGTPGPGSWSSGPWRWSCSPRRASRPAASARWRCRARRLVEDLFGLVGGGCPDTQRATCRRSRPGEGGGVEVGRAGSRRPCAAQKRGVLDALLADRVGERVGAADRDGGVLAAVERVPPERRRRRRRRLAG